ncbi:MAG: lipase family protein [Acidimicrobiia bacterium]
MRRIRLVLAVLMVLPACSQGWTGNRTSEESTTRIISAERIAAPDGARAWQVEYASETIGGEATSVTGWVAIPEVQGTMPVMAWAHPTAGLGDECAPSLSGGRTPFHFSHELEAGWAVVATDYEGLGGPGLHPYLVSESEARSIFDIARAAHELDDRVGTELLLWGFSQGGHAALSAAALAPDLAPDFHIVATVAVAPAVDLIGWPPQALGTSQQGYIVAMVAGFAAAYGLDVGDVLTRNAMDLLDEVETSCVDPTFYAVARLSSSGAFVVDPSQLEPWATLLTDNSPEYRTIESPVLLVLGDEDELWPVDLLPTIVDRMCDAGTPVATSIHLGEDHGSVGGAARGEIHTFLADRLGGLPFEPDC